MPCAHSSRLCGHRHCGNKENAFSCGITYPERGVSEAFARRLTGRLHTYVYATRLHVRQLRIDIGNVGDHGAHDFVVKMVARVYECMSPWLAEALERYPSYDAQAGQLLQRVWDSSARRPWPRVRQHDVMQVLWAKWAPNERNYCSW